MQQQKAKNSQWGNFLFATFLICMKAKVNLVKYPLTSIRVIWGVPFLQYEPELARRL